jgi:hypothetical protein
MNNDSRIFALTIYLIIDLLIIDLLLCHVVGCATMLRCTTCWCVIELPANEKHTLNDPFRLKFAA